MSENSIEFSLSNSEQRDSWLNSGHRTLDADMRSKPVSYDINFLLIHLYFLWAEYKPQKLNAILVEGAFCW